MNKNKFTYKKSGVDIKSADKFVNFISSNTQKKKNRKKVLTILVDLVLFQIYPKILKVPKLLLALMELEQKLK